MSLYPGGKVPSGPGFVYSVQDDALTDSVAAAIETEMSNMFLALKNLSLPDTGKDDRRILFVAIARGILQYLSDHQAGNINAQPPGNAPPLPVTIQINMDSSS
jgi:hypothetical protein